ncbi:unnamed protein product [Wuchereria bancrofti]|uniref:Uncharacterized protein n=2 Tax=Wuchereria bancrofti TaxID=6293 RepID=A0A3P7EIT6_WUCBA|nr:unnamed protein product [Wuchereria bancrofti]
MNPSLAMDPRQLSNDINEKFCSIDEERQVVATTTDSFSKSVVPKVLSRSYENLQWIIEKTQFAPHSLRVRNDRYLFLCIAVFEKN